MYLIAIHVPIYVDGDRTLVATDWKRELVLLRDSLEGRFGPLWVLSPRLPADPSLAHQPPLDGIRETDDGLRLIPSFDRRCRAREYWLRERLRWKADLARLVPQADVVHAGMCDVYRPINFAGHLEGLRRRKPTVFVQDTDIVCQARELGDRSTLRRRAESRVYAYCFERFVRYGVKTAALSLLKGKAVYERYRRFARNAHVFQDVSYLRREAAGEDVVRARVESLQRSARPMRLVYCGRLIPRKGVDHGVRIVGRAAQLGADVTFDVIGDGPERQSLEHLPEQVGAQGRVRFLGARPYGPALLQLLSSYDAMLFCPRAEDTPRMIFDGYAAGVPLVGYEIPYVRERRDEDGAVVLVPRDDVEAGARILLGLDRRREELAALASAAHEAGQFHAADNWYRRRAEWTFEAVARFHHDQVRR